VTDIRQHFINYRQQQCTQPYIEIDDDVSETQRDTCMVGLHVFFRHNVNHRNKSIVWRLNELLILYVKYYTDKVNL